MFRKSHATVLAVGSGLMAIACDPARTSTDQVNSSGSKFG